MIPKEAEKPRGAFSF